MKKGMLDDEFMDKEIENFLASYVIKECDKQRIDETINVLKDYMPKEKKTHSLIKLIKNELTYVSKGYLIASLILIIAGVFLTRGIEVNSYYIMLCVSPMPVLIGLFEITKNRVGNMWELEKSMKYSYSLVSLAKILIVIGISCILNIIFSLVLCSRSDAVNFLQCTAAWIVPMSIVFSVELLIFYIISNVYISLCVSSIWIAAIVIFSEIIVSFLESVSSGILILIMLCSVAIVTVSVYRFYEREKSYEGEFLWN